MVLDGESDRLRQDALVAARRAREARELAVAIELRRRPLAHRVDPVRHLHTDEVWSSGAARTSRTVLERVIAAQIWQAHDQLGQTVGALQRLADELDRQARVARRRSEVLAAPPVAPLA